MQTSTPSRGYDVERFPVVGFIPPVNGRAFASLPLSAAVALTVAFDGTAEDAIEKAEVPEDEQ